MEQPVTTSHYEQISTEIDDDDTQLCDVVVDRSHNTNINLPTADFLPCDMSTAIFCLYPVVNIWMQAIR